MIILYQNMIIKFMKDVKNRIGNNRKRKRKLNLISISGKNFKNKRLKKVKNLLKAMKIGQMKKKYNMIKSHKFKRNKVHQVMMINMMQIM